MRAHSVLVLSICIFGAFAQDTVPDTVSDIFKIYNECQDSEGLAPCLKMKVLTLLDRVSRMEKLDLMEGVVIKSQAEDNANATSLEEEEKNLPRALDEKNEALTEMIFDRAARMIGSKTIEISVPTLIESARGARFGDGGGKKGGGLGGAKKKKKIGFEIKKLFLAIMAKKLALIPLYIGGLFILALKALAEAKIALLIVGIIIIKKLIAKKSQGSGHVQHVSAGWSSGGESSGGWSSGGQGGGWESGWGKRSIEGAQDIAYSSQKPS